jgi:hypothetical protein
MMIQLEFILANIYPHHWREFHLIISNFVPVFGRAFLYRAYTSFFSFEGNNLVISETQLKTTRLEFS